MKLRQFDVGAGIAISSAWKFGFNCNLLFGDAGFQLGWVRIWVFWS